MRRTGLAFAAAGVPLALLVMLGGLALLRMPSANTLWYEERPVEVSVSTLENFEECEELTLTTASVEVNGGTKFTYTLSGGGQGPEEECLEHAVSNISIPIGECFNPEMSNGGDVVVEQHPNGWVYSPKNSTAGKLSGKRIKWDVDDTVQDGYGPFDDLRFSVTFRENDYETMDAPAYMFAANVETQIGTVTVPECPPETQEVQGFGAPGIQSTNTEPGPKTTEPPPKREEPATEPKPTEETGEDTQGGEGSGSSGNPEETVTVEPEETETPTAEPTATATPTPEPTATPKPKPNEHATTEAGARRDGRTGGSSVRRLCGPAGLSMKMGGGWPWH
ncbi:MAG: hypothetical protein U5Q44_10895 [Dehalococcoidia bacterium]|nr:hypothetical protein [Dehalococcoidia bacterium]